MEYTINKTMTIVDYTKAVIDEVDRLEANRPISYMSLTKEIVGVDKVFMVLSVIIQKAWEDRIPAVLVAGVLVNAAKESYTRYIMLRDGMKES